MKLGPVRLDAQQHGKCSYDPTLTGAQECNQVATFHVWFGDFPDPGPDGGPVFTCTDHAAQIPPEDVGDLHRAAYDCLAAGRSLWLNPHGIKGESWCYDPEDPTSTAVGAEQTQGVSA